MIRRKIDDVTYETYYSGQNYVAKYPGQHSLKYDYEIVLKNIDKDAYILDIGCRGGETVKMFQDMGYKNAYGTDIGEEAKIKIIQNYGEDWTNKYFKVGDIQNGNPFDFKFDFITFSHTLEHLMQPEKGMNIVHNSLNDDGFLFIAVPSDYEDANGDIQMMLADQGAQFHWIFYESEKDIIEFCESSGFKVLDSKDLKETKHEYLVWLQKEEKDNLLNDDIQFYQKPFVHWTMDDMFEQSFYEKLKEDFPKVEDFDLDDEVMGGRFEVAPDNPKFWEVLENSKFDKGTTYNSFNKIEDKTDKSLNDIFVYFDFSMCRDGYMREVHTDMNNRIFSFMLYFSDVNGEGGTLELYSMNGQPQNIDSDDNISLEKTVQPKENLGVWKLDDGNSWHAVPKMKGNNGWRKFVYVAVTSKQVGVWKNKQSQWPNLKQLKIKETLKF